MIRMKNSNKSINEILSEISDDEKIEFEKKWEGMLKGWKKNSKKKEEISCALVMIIWKEIEELVWLGIGVGILVIVFKFVFFLGF